MSTGLSFLLSRAFKSSAGFNTDTKKKKNYIVLSDQDLYGVLSH